VAEGVERSDQAMILTQLGCELGQGYFFSKPHPADTFAEMVANDEVLGRETERTRA
jgi:EAL domain-containing protein (putative c-di-GMP-specific phosphodiesterase class I)